VASQHSDDHRSISYIYCYNLIGLATLYLEKNQLNLIPDLIQEICDLSKKYKLQSCWSEAAIIKGELLLKNNQEDLYIALFNESFQFCTENSLYADKETWLNNMIVLCEAKSNYKEALHFSKMLIENKKDQETKTKSFDISKILENKESEILVLENKNRAIRLQQYQLEQFAYIVAHDLRTPLSNISNFIGLFSKKYRDQVDDQNKYFLDLVSENSQKLHLMLDELLLYITVNNIKGDIPWTNVENILTKIGQKRGENFEDKKGSLEFTSLPEIKMHPSHLKIVLDQMIKNSLKFSKKDQDAKIKIEVIKSEDEFRIRVIDNGIGIKKEYQQQIFDLFKQLDKINYTGIGMGLAICKKIITLYGGDIKVSNNDWDGTTFEFNIPKKDKLN